MLRGTRFERFLDISERNADHATVKDFRQRVDRFDLYPRAIQESGIFGAARLSVPETCLVGLIVYLPVPEIAPVSRHDAVDVPAPCLRILPCGGWPRARRNLGWEESGYSPRATPPPRNRDWRSLTALRRFDPIAIEIRSRPADPRALHKTEALHPVGREGPFLAADMGTHPIRFLCRQRLGPRRSHAAEAERQEP